MFLQGKANEKGKQNLLLKPLRNGGKWLGCLRDGGNSQGNFTNGGQFRDA